MLHQAVVVVMGVEQAQRVVVEVTTTPMVLMQAVGIVQREVEQNKK
jgi:hypothetical protein